jgi:hypothetical protein
MDIRIGGGPSSVGAFLDANSIDHIHIAVVRIVLGRGERLWDGLEGLDELWLVSEVVNANGTHPMGPDPNGSDRLKAWIFLGSTDPRLALPLPQPGDQR